MSEINDLSKASLLLYQDILTTRINIQTILRLLIDKGVFTKEELHKKRAYVSAQKMYTEKFEEINKKKDTIRRN